MIPVIALCARLEITPAGAIDGLDQLPVVPWVSGDDNSWQAGKPLFELSDPRFATTAAGWVAVSADHILLHVVVKDAQHVNHKSGDAIWMGDSIQIGIDARGDGAGAMPKDYSMVGPDDASICAALTDSGVQVWAHAHGVDARKHARKDIPCKIVRDEDAKTTTYDVSLPWSDFQTVAGIYPTFALAVQVNDSSEGAKEQSRLFWSEGAGGKITPGLFNRLVLGSPKYMVRAGTTRQDLWRASDFGEITVAVAGAEPCLIRAKFGQQQQDLPVPGAPEGQWRRFCVRVYPQALPAEPVILSVQVVNPNQPDMVLASAKADLADTGAVISRFAQRVEELANQQTSPLMQRHLRSLEYLVNDEWVRAQLTLGQNPQMAQEAVANASKMLALFNDPKAASWDTFELRQRRLVLAFISADDRTLQPYRLLLPKNWQPEKVYPLIVYLHGAGNPNPLFWISETMEEPNSEGADCIAAPAENVYILEPWGRGNHSYTGIGETDVWEAIADMTRSFKTDPERTYLMGFSMGGGGTWSLGMRTPDRWAALAINSGAPGAAPTGIGLPGNLAGVPVRIWHGDADSAAGVENSYKKQAELKKNGIEPEMIIAPGIGHVFYRTSQEAQTYAWLLKHVRARPDKFSFVADTADHLGRNGITMKRDPAVSPLPRFECRVEGQNVEIASEGTPGLDIMLGEGGLGLNGQVTLTWNGQKKYEGPAKRIQLNNTK